MENGKTENKSSTEKENQKKPIASAENQEGSFLGSLLTFTFWFGIVFTFLWNWDGFWQTEFEALTSFQEKYFTVKFNEEQLKVSRIRQNVRVIENIRERTEQIESRLNKRLARIERERDNALERQELAQSQIEAYLDKENLKCRYYDSSLRIIDHLSRKYSEEELKRTVACTNVECENIFYYRAKAKEVCG